MKLADVLKMKRTYVVASRAEKIVHEITVALYEQYGGGGQKEILLPVMHEYTQEEVVNEIISRCTNEGLEISFDGNSTYTIKVP